LYSIEPSEASSARNLFSSNDKGLACGDETGHFGPEVTDIGGSFHETGRREGLARAGAGPQGEGVGPASKAGSIGPSPDAGEQMNLGVPLEILGLDIHDATFVNVTGRDEPGIDEVTQPCGSMGIVLVVVGGATWH
jgi:hypothetical protein